MKEKTTKKIKKILKIMTCITMPIIMTILVAMSAIILNNKEENTLEAYLSKQELAKATEYAKVTDQDGAIDGTEFVKFNAFFLRDIDGDGYAEKLRGTCKQVGKEDILYMELNVLTNGRLENGVITINGDNFYAQTSMPKDNEIKENAIGNNIRRIELKTINTGTQKLLTTSIRSGNYNSAYEKTAAIGNDTTKYSRINSVTITGTHVSAEGISTEIEKTIEFDLDWYGTTKAELPTKIEGRANLSQKQEVENILNQETNQVELTFDIGIQEKDNQLILKKSYIEGEIPNLNGYAPIDVEITGLNVTYTYDKNTQKFTAQREAKLDENGKVTESAYYKSNGTDRYNIYTLNVKYPKEAYDLIGGDTIELKIPVQGYYEGYNNTNEEFDNPYKSNVVEGAIVVTFSKPVGNVAIFKVTVGKKVNYPTERYIVSKNKPLKIYNGKSTEEVDDKYIVKWLGVTGSEGNTTGIIMKETKNGETQVTDQFIKKDTSTESMENLTINTGIYFGNVEELLGNNGWIKVYNDETNELIETFTVANWNKYTENKPYTYGTPVKHIRIETSETTPSNSITVYNIKELDDSYITENYTREQFDNLQYIESTLTGYISGNYINTDIHQAVYEAPYSVATLNLSKTIISTQETEKNMILKIEAKGNEQSNVEEWKNGTFLIKAPKDIIGIEINSVLTDDPNVKVISYEQYEEGENNYIKIITENDKKASYNININCNITPDPRTVTQTESFELYANNEETAEYYYKSEDIYDVNDNGNVIEIVNKTTTNIDLVSPNSLLTNQIATNYDEKGGITLAPRIAKVGKEQRTAKVNVQIKNNYSSTISEVKILGRIPYEGNKYTINGANMGSTFTTTMQNPGITIPEELKGIATVYYSENGEATKDITNPLNGWTTKPTDYSKVKSYLIDLGDYELQKDESHDASYTINIPKGLNYNEISYSHHAVYFTLDTAQGKYRTQTEPNKIGFMIAKQYDLELTKYQKEKNKKVSGATYSITEEGAEESKTRITDINGTLKLESLYVDKIYTIKEIKSPEEYELNEDEIKIKATEENGELKVTKLQGTTKGIDVVKPQGEEDYKLKIEVEDEAKANLNIVKVEQGTNQKLGGIKFKITGKGFTEEGKIVTTTGEGEISLKGLTIGEEYTIEETKAEGYYIINPIKFVINNNNGTYAANITQGTVKTNTIKTENEIPTINITVENEKIPTYNLEINKVIKGKTEPLKGVGFKLYKGSKEVGEYETDANGKIQIEKLYIYDPSKNVDQTYTLKETVIPEGYTKIKDIKLRAENKEGTLKIELEEGTIKDQTTDGNTIKITIENEPSFKIVKKDAETEEVLPGTKFAIYNIDNGETPALDSKNNIVGTKETIDGKQYYIVTTDENGEIAADLKEGLYKAVEVKATDNKYDLTNNEYYFGIGASKEGKTEIDVVQASAINAQNDVHIKKVITTSDGGYFATGTYGAKTLKIGDTIVEKKGTAGIAGIAIKYNSNGQVMWAKDIGHWGDTYLLSATEMCDGDIIVAGNTWGEFKIEDITIPCNGGTDGIIIRLDSQTGKVKWGDSIGGIYSDEITTVSATEEGGLIVGGLFGYTMKKDNIELINDQGGIDGFVIKYNKYGKAVWGNSIGGTEEKEEKITSVVETKDGGVLAGGYYCTSTIEVGTDTFENKGDTDGIAIKYKSDGKVEWAKNISGIGADYINTVEVTKDGSCFIGGYSTSSTFEVEDETHEIKGWNSGFIVKYKMSGEHISTDMVKAGMSCQIYEIKETKNNGIVAVGTYYGELKLGNYNLSSKGQDDGFIARYDSEGKVKSVKSIGNEGDEYLYSIAITEDNSYIVGGIITESIKVGEKELQYSGSGRDGMVIKLEEKEIEPEIPDRKDFGNNVNKEATTELKVTDGFLISGTGHEQFKVIPTSDGGYFAAGVIVGTKLQLGNNTIEADVQKGILIKYDSNKNIEWIKDMNGYTDCFGPILETTDGNFLISTYIWGDANSDGVLVKGKVWPDIFVLKFSSEGKLLGGEALGSNGSIKTLCNASDGGYYAVGEFNDTINNTGDTILENEGNVDGVILKFNNSAKIEWARKIGKEGWDYLKGVVGTLDGGAIAVGHFTSNIVETGKIKLERTDETDGIIIKYDKYGNTEWAKSIRGNGEDFPITVDILKDGSIVVGGSTRSSQIETGDIVETRKGTSEQGFIIKYDANGNAKLIKILNSNNTSNIAQIKAMDNGGFLVTGNAYELTLGKYNISNNGEGAGFIARFNKDIEIRSLRNFTGTYNEANRISVTDKGEYIVSGSFSSKQLNTEIGTFTASTVDTYIFKLKEEEIAPEISDSNAIEILNQVKQYKITTDVKELNGTKGGEISGEDWGPYEKVKYGNNSIKTIRMTPDETHEIIGITVNGKDYPYTVNADGTFKMPQFTNMQEDKHIVVTYAEKDTKITINKVDKKTQEPIANVTFKLKEINAEKAEEELYLTEVTTNSQGQAITSIPFGKYEVTEVNTPEGYQELENPVIIEFTESNNTFTIENIPLAKIIVHHYLKGKDGNYTTTKVAETENYQGKIGENYMTSPHLDLKQYTLVKENGEYLIPRNSAGKYTEDEQIVIYYYEERGVPLTVHHYIEGTQNQVPLKDGTQAQDEKYSGKEGEKYSTNSVPEEKLSSKYELVETPSNSKGTYEKEEIVVTYYYKEVERNLNIVKKDKETNAVLQGAKFTIKNKETNETQEFTTKANGKIETSLKVGVYEITETGAPVGYILPENTTQEITITKQSEQTITLNITNEKKKGIVIVHHYIEGTTTKVPSTEKNVEVQDEEKEGKLGEIYTTEKASNVSENYQFTIATDNQSGTFKEETIEVIYYYRPKNYEYSIEYYFDEIIDNNLTEKHTAPYDSTISTYTDKVKENYRLDKEENLPLKITEDKTKNIIKIYYVKTIKTITVNKVWVDTKDQQERRPEKIVFQVFNGEEKVTEYTLDVETENSHEFTGLTKYDKNNKEIEYTIVETVVPGKGHENDLKFYSNSVVKSTTEKDTFTVTNKFIGSEDKIEIPVTKIWVDNGDEKERRPEKITLVLKNGETIVEQKEISKNTEGLIVTAKDKQGTDINLEEKDETVKIATESWEGIKFKEIPKYDANGKEIKYTIVEKADKFYTTEYSSTELVEGDELIITNTFTVPTETITVKAKKVWVEKDKNNVQLTEEEIKNVRPEEIILVLKDPVNKQELEEKVVNASTNWECTFGDKENAKDTEIVANLLKYNQTTGREIDYSKYIVEEKKSPKAEEKLYNEQETLKFYKAETKYTEEGFVVTNTFEVPDEKISIKATKKWEDASDKFELRPNKVTVNLYANQEKIETKELNTSNNWSYTFTVAKYDEKAKEIEYTVDENQVPFYTTQIEKEQNVNAYTITNKMMLKETKIEKTATKEITSLTDKITYNISYKADLTGAELEQYAGKQIKVTVTDILPYAINPANSKLENGTYASRKIIWEADILVEKNANNQYVLKTESPDFSIVGQTITLEKEIEVKYVGLPTQTGAKIANVVKGKVQIDDAEEEKETTAETITDFDMSVTLKKEWNDNNDERGRRPEEIEVVFNKGEKTENIKLKAEENWTKTINNLPKYDDEGNEIEYKVSEDKVIKYYKQYKESDTKTVRNVQEITSTVTNTVNETLTFKFTKVAQEDTSKVLPGTEFKVYRKICEDSTHEHEKTKIDVENVDTTCWEELGTYISNGKGEVTISDLEREDEYRLIETKTTEERVMPDGQWRLNFITEETNETGLITIGEVKLKITKVGNPPAFGIKEDGSVYLTNKKYFVFPVSGDIGTTIFYSIGVILAIVGTATLIIKKERNMKNEK